MDNPYAPPQTDSTRFRGFKPAPDLEPSPERALFFLILGILACWLISID